MRELVQILFGVEPDPYKSSTNTIVQLMERNGEISSSLRGSFGAEIKRFEGIADLEDIKPFIRKNMEKIAEIRNKMEHK